MYFNQSEIINLFELYIAGKASQEEKDILVEWIKSNPKVTKLIESEFLNSNDKIDLNISKQNIEKIHNIIKRDYSTIDINTAKRKNQKFVRILLRVAAILLLPLITGYAVYLFMNVEIQKNPLSVMVAKGQKVKIKLPDGSTVWINSDSRLSYNNQFNKTDRKISLEGEGFFEVKPNKKCPFIVQAYDMEIEALGTSFLVTAYDKSAISTVLKEGRTKVTTPVGKFFMHPNDRITYNGFSKKITEERVYDASVFSSWIDDYIHFENEKFEQIIATLERSYNVSIEVTNKDLLNRRFTGTVPNQGVESVLKYISMSVPFQIQKQNDLLLIK